MRAIKLKLSAVLRAIQRAKSVTDDWQAECCEILMIPAIAKRWQELNARLGNGLRIERIDGLRYSFVSREDNQARCDADGWAEVAGYSLILMQLENGYCSRWNSVQRSYYCHSASTAWDGVRRETISQFVDDLRNMAHGWDDGDKRRRLAAAGIDVVNDLSPVPA